MPWAVRTVCVRRALIRLSADLKWANPFRLEQSTGFRVAIGSSNRASPWDHNNLRPSNLNLLGRLRLRTQCLLRRLRQLVPMLHGHLLNPRMLLLRRLSRRINRLRRKESPRTLRGRYVFTSQSFANLLCLFYLIERDSSEPRRSNPLPLRPPRTRLLHPPPKPNILQPHLPRRLRSPLSILAPLTRLGRIRRRVLRSSQHRRQHLNLSCNNHPPIRPSSLSMTLASLMYVIPRFLRTVPVQRWLLIQITGVCVQS